MILTGSVFALPFASAEEASAGPVLKDYSVEITNVEPKTEEGEEFIVSLKFDQELTTDRYTANAFNVLVSGRSLQDMGFRNPEVTVSDSDSSVLVLDFKGLENSTWTYLVSRTLSISLKSNYYEDIMNKDGVGVPEDGWTDINTYIPAFDGATGINDVFEKVSYTPGSTATDTKESVTFKMIGDVKARAMNTIQILNGDCIDTDNTIIPARADATVVVHSHNFKSMTNADMVGTIARSFNGFAADYEMTAVPDTETPTNSTLTITAKTASDTPGLDKATMNLFAYSTPNDRIVQQTCFKQEIATAEARLAAIDDTKVTPSQKTALQEAVNTASEEYKTVGADTGAVAFNQMRNSLRNAVNAAADNAISTTSATRDGSVNLSIAGGQEWIDAITAVEIDGQAAEPSSYSINNGTLSINSLQFPDPARTKTYNITIKAAPYADVTKDVTINFYGAQTFQIRQIDPNGKVLKKKTYTLDELKALSDNKDHYYHAICTMRGVTAFKGQGVKLTDLLNDAGIEFKEGMNAQLRTNDSIETSENNDPEDENAYYWRGNFTYENLMQDRYYFPDLYDENSDLAKAAQSTGGKVTFNAGDPIRTAAGASANRVAEDPMIAFSFTERSWSSRNPASLESEAYDEADCTDNAFRFLFGTALDTEDGVTVTKAETTLWSLSYQTFGVDILESTPYTASFGEPSAQTVLPGGKTFTVPVVVTSDNPLSAAQLSLSCNADVARIVSVKAADGIEMKDSTISEDGSTALFSFFNNTASAAEGLTVAEVTMESVAEGISELTMDSGTAAATGDMTDYTIKLPEEALSVTVDSGDKISVESYTPLVSLVKYTPGTPAADGTTPFYNGKAMYKEPAAEDGTVTYVYPVEGSVTPEDAKAAITNGEGSPAEISLPGSETVTEKAGDINGNNVVNIVDAQAAYDMATGQLKTITETMTDTSADHLHWLMADVNKDNRVTADDARGIQYFVHRGTFEIS